MTTSAMVAYLNQRWSEGRANGVVAEPDTLTAACIEAGYKCLRLLLMTVLTNIFGLPPMLLDDGVAKTIAVPRGISLTTLTLLVMPLSM